MLSFSIVSSCYCASIVPLPMQNQWTHCKLITIDPLLDPLQTILELPGSSGDIWGRICGRSIGGRGNIFIYSCYAQLISFENDCFYSLWTRIYEYVPSPPQLSIFCGSWFEGSRGIFMFHTRLQESRGKLLLENLKSDVSAGQNSEFCGVIYSLLWCISPFSWRDGANYPGRSPSWP